ncbi:hypothetical protein GCM10011507_21930 [Edaphobacter acidisoli]|uniref:Uncharacterized protein n=1 Tax=Edaphobacter acidisoli TaxID=2040573 RepID=A0A916RTU7_9BACT|nr:hypothetical protein GCM10011507_21930 [Edaphobacter acidisoli]
MAGIARTEVRAYLRNNNKSNSNNKGNDNNKGNNTGKRQTLTIRGDGRKGLAGGFERYVDLALAVGGGDEGGFVLAGR